MNDYFDAALSQLEERARQLCALIPRNLGREVAALEVICRDRLEKLGDRLRALRDSSELRHPQNRTERLRLFRRAWGDLSHLESVAIATLCRWNEEDRRINSVADRLAREIRFPLPTPVISCLSQRYYHTYPEFRLVCVPPAESRFLLHLPDLYHELAHSLLAFETDAKLEGFQRQHIRAVEDALQYLSDEMRKEASGMGPETFKRYLANWSECWPYWGIEFFCDLFATYAIGPAFGWAHLHLSTCAHSDPFEVPLFATSAHPPDAARMTAILFALRRLGFGTEADLIEGRWRHLVDAADAQESPEYRRCFPTGLLRQVEEAAHIGALTLGCSLAHPDMPEPGRCRLNEAWRVFWSSPSEYASWERKAVEGFARELVVN